MNAELIAAREARLKWLAQPSNNSIFSEDDNGQEQIKESQHDMEEDKKLNDSILQELAVIKFDISSIKDNMEKIVTSLDQLKVAHAPKVETGFKPLAVYANTKKKLSLPSYAMGKPIFGDNLVTTATTVQRNEDFNSDNEDTQKLCGVCKKECTVMSIMVPCGHYPYCDSCIKEIFDNFSKLSPDIFEVHDETVIGKCPNCVQDVKATSVVRLLEEKEEVERILSY